MTKLRKPKVLVMSLLLPFVVGGLGGMVTYPALQPWYAGLAKPDFNPPNWVFGPVWTLLYALMGVSLYLVLTSRSKKPKRTALALFGAQLVLNFLWSAVFFGLKQPFWAVVAILALLAAIIWTAVAFWRFSHWAAYLLVPYILWVTFAATLNIAVSILNPASEQVGNYAQCAKANGSVVLTSYPPVCMARDGQRFTGP